MLVADLAVDLLRAAGARAIFGVPGGGGNLDLIAAAGRAGLPFVLTSTETAGAIAALAQSEVTGRIGACLTTLGPGAASAVNGVACAFLERAPIVVFTDTQPATFEHQRLDHAALMRPIVNWSGTLAAGAAHESIACAIRHATQGRPGPVHVDCPAGVAAAAAGPEGPACKGEDENVVGRTLRSGDRAAFERLVAAARKPLVIAGLGARGSEDATAIRALCASHRMPAMVTYKGKGIVADDDEWFAGVFTNAAIEQPVIDECDLLIAIGLDPVELLPRPWANKPPIVSCNPWNVDDTHVPFAAQIVAPVVDGIRVIDGARRGPRDAGAGAGGGPRDTGAGRGQRDADAGRGERDAGWDSQKVRTLVEEQKARVRVKGDGLTAQRVVEIAAARLAGSCSRVTVDSGAHMLPATMLWPVREPNGMLISNGLSTMGFALPAAIGAALLDRSRPTVALTGDGGLLMCAGELLTVAREKLPIVTVVFNDASLSLIEIKQQARKLAPAGVALGAVDWVKMAESAGVAAWTASADDELDRAIAEAQHAGGPALIEAKIDRSNYGATLRAVRG